MPRFITFLVCVLLASVSEAGELSPEYLRTVEQIDPYYALLSKHLFVTAADFGRMVWLSSFPDEMAVSVYSVSSAKGKYEKPVFRITVTRPNKSLWDFPGAASDKGLVISRHDTEIDADLAFTIQRAWRTILAKDPIPSDSDSLTFDGFTAIFSVVMPDGKTMTRDTANPGRPPATDLVGLGIDLSLYCTAPAEEQKLKRGEIVRRLQKLIDTYGKP